MRHWALWVFLLMAACAFVLWVAPAHADSPAEQLARLAARLDEVEARLNGGDASGAQAAYKAFDDGWFDIEDGIREQSRSSYRAIEAAMGEVKATLTVQPFDAARSRTALAALKSECNTFIKSPSAREGQPAASPARVTVASLVQHLDRARSELDEGHTPAALAAVRSMKQDWIEVEGLVKAKSAQAYAAI